MKTRIGRIGLIGLMIIGVALEALAVLSGCMTSKVTTVTPGGVDTNGVVYLPVTNTEVVVNQMVLGAECAGLQLVGTPALTYALQKDPTIRPILVDIQTALTGALHGADTNVVATIQGLAGNNQALKDQLTPLITAASNLRGQLLVKYGSVAGVQIAEAILEADLNIVTAALAAGPGK